MNKVIIKLKEIIIMIIPQIHNLPDVVYIRWMNRDYFIDKDKR